MIYNTRIQLKSDIEDNWKKLVPKDGNLGFIPLNGEFIIYSPDTIHPYCRLKVGDGVTNVNSLPFIDSGTINGEEVEIVKLETFNDFPSPGSKDKLYIDLETNRIYHYDSHSGYTQLSNFSFTINKTEVSKITNWTSGVIPEFNIENNILKLKNGQLPQLSYYDTQAVSNIQKE